MLTLRDVLGWSAAEERERFEEHLAICDGCQAYVEEMRDTLRALGRLPSTGSRGKRATACLPPSATGERPADPRTITP